MGCCASKEPKGPNDDGEASGVQNEQNPVSECIFVELTVQKREPNTYATQDFRCRPENVVAALLDEVFLCPSTTFVKLVHRP